MVLSSAESIGSKVVQAGFGSRLRSPYTIVPPALSEVKARARASNDHSRAKYPQFQFHRNSRFYSSEVVLL